MEYDEYAQPDPPEDDQPAHPQTKYARRRTQPEPPDTAQFEPLRQVFHDQLHACLEECAHGRRGLFSTTEYLGEAAQHLPWPEAERLRELAAALQSILAQSEEQDTQVDQFLDLCSIHGESDPGEPKLARAFLAEIKTRASSKPATS